MTFYWWSHWFWITLLSNNILSLVVVFTYPSQKVIMLDYKQNLKLYNKSIINKLYQNATANVAASKSKNNYNKHDNVIFDDKNNDDKDLHKDVSCEKRNQDTHSNYDSDNDNNTTSNNTKHNNSSNSSRRSNIKSKDFINAPHLIYTFFINGTDKDVKRSAEIFDNSSNDNDKSNHSNMIESDINGITNKSILEEINNNSSISMDSINFTNISIPIRINNDEIVNNTKAEYLEKDEWHNFSESSEHIAIIDTKHKIPFILENVNGKVRKVEAEQRSRKSKGLIAEYRQVQRFMNNSIDAKSLLTRSASTTPNNYINDDSNVSSEALAVQHTYFLDVGGISAICIAIFAICSMVGTLSLILYRRRYLNKPQTLSEPDSSVYIDDNTMRDNSDEMYSLDNDSFLNSLEAMTIQNYWTDTVKHTKL